MPTESTFLSAATALDGVAADADELLLPTQRALTPDVLRGGLLTEQVHRAIDDAAATSAQVAAACRSAAEECRWRAQQCEAHWRSVHEWEQADERYDRALRSWQGRSMAYRDDPTVGAPGPQPRSPGARPEPGYGWIA